MNAVEVRDLIADEMKKRGLTQTELARQTGLEQGNISRYLNWAANSITPSAPKILDVLGLELTVRVKNDRTR